MQPHDAPSLNVVLLALLVAGVTLLADLATPLGVAGGVPYVLLILVGWWFPQRGHIFALAALASTLIVVGFFLSPSGAETWMVIINRCYALVAVWAMAGILHFARGKRDELVKTQFEVIRAKEVAENANRAKSSFLASMSHELRTPMNAIIGFGEMLSHETIDPLTKKQHEYIGYILQSGGHLMELINDVLELSKIESGELVLEIENVGLLNSINEAVQMIKARAEKNNIAINVNSTELERLNSPCMVRADAGRLRQILLNLLSNAVKYNREGGTVDVFCANDSIDLVRVHVSDTGAGILLENQGSIFQPFNRLGREAGPVEGSGIGLAITKDLVERMGGEIGFESVSGRGSTFWIDIPKANIKSWTGGEVAGDELSDGN